MAPLVLDPDRLFPVEPSARHLARDLYGVVKDLPIVSFHGHVDAAVLAGDRPFSDPAALLVTPDHYVTRRLHAAGVALDDLGVRPVDGSGVVADPRAVWAALCAQWPILFGTATHLWLTHTLAEVFGSRSSPPPTARSRSTTIWRLAWPPRSSARVRWRGASAWRFSPPPTVRSTTWPATRPCVTRRGSPVASSPPSGPTPSPTRRVPTGWGTWRSSKAVSSTSTSTYDGFLAALAEQRHRFRALGAVATDHGHRTTRSVALGRGDAVRLFDRLRSAEAGPADAELFRAHMLMEMARMSCDDGLVMQLHAGVVRNHDGSAWRRFGADIGADFPAAISYTEALQPLLKTFGSDPAFTLVVYTVDETAYGRELAPMASYYPALRLGSPWWFLDSPDAMRRCLSAAVESAGFSRFAGFVDDTRAFCSIPARHDMARRTLCAALAVMSLEGRFTPDAAHTIAHDQCDTLPRRVFRWRPGTT